MKCIADLHIKDPGSALTHFIAFVGSAAAAAPLLMKAAAEPDASRLQIAALAVFIVSMILLYAASTVYHTLDISEKVNRLLRKLDHMMIFILIAGTYTPICLIVLGNRSGFFCWPWCGPSRQPESSLTPSGSAVPSGFLP